jgi:hypothetical protein
MSFLNVTMTTTAFAIENFISLQNLSVYIEKPLNEVEADIEDYGIPLYRVNGIYGLTIEDTEAYVKNIFHYKQKELLDKIYTQAAAERNKPAKVTLEELSDVMNELIGDTTVNLITLADNLTLPNKVKKTDTKSCVKAVLEATGDYSKYLKQLVVKEQGSKQFVDTLAAILKHHKSKTIDGKVQEINKAIMELWSEAQ